MCHHGNFELKYGTPIGVRGRYGSAFAKTTFTHSGFPNLDRMFPVDNFDQQMKMSFPSKMRVNFMICIVLTLPLASCEKALDRSYKKAMDEAGEEKARQAEAEARSK